MLIRSWFGAAVIALSFGGAAPAATWSLYDEGGNLRGTFDIDFAASVSSNAGISGDLGFYDIESWAVLDSPSSVAGEQVSDYFRFFSAITGQDFFTDFGDGSSHNIHMNDSSVEIGTLDGPIQSIGGTYLVIINEIFNFDETYTYCVVYEDLYDPDTGDYIGQGGCLQTDSFTSYTIESGYYHYGTLVGPTISAVPLPAAGLLLPAGLAALIAIRRRRRPRGPTAG